MFTNSDQSEQKAAHLLKEWSNGTLWPTEYVNPSTELYSSPATRVWSITQTGQSVLYCYIKLFDQTISNWNTEFYCFPFSNFTASTCNTNERWIFVSGYLYELLAEHVSWQDIHLWRILYCSQNRKDDEIFFSQEVTSQLWLLSLEAHFLKICTRREHLVCSIKGQLSWLAAVPRGTNRPSYISLFIWQSANIWMHGYTSNLSELLHTPILWSFAATTKVCCQSLLYVHTLLFPFAKKEYVNKTVHTYSSYTN